MDCYLERAEFRPDGIFGNLKDSSGHHIAVTLEHAFQDSNGDWMPKLPDGTYTCQRYASPKFGYDVFEVMNVPGATYIEIHIGNFNSDSDGCVLLGYMVTQMHGAWAINSSKATFVAFMGMQNGVDQFQLTVTSQS
jgi:hypothetical protein